MSSRDDDRKENEIMMKELIRKHQNVITFSENIENLYTYIALMLMVSNTVITCGLAFTLIKVRNYEFCIIKGKKINISDIFIRKSPSNNTQIINLTCTFNMLLIVIRYILIEYNI